MNYTSKWKLEEKGWRELVLSAYDKEKFEKLCYVEDYLSPSIQHAKCGWDHCEYYIFKNENCQEEYVALCPNEGKEGARYYNVTANSLGAIAQTIWKEVFA